MMQAELGRQQQEELHQLQLQFQSVQPQQATAIAEMQAVVAAHGSRGGSRGAANPASAAEVNCTVAVTGGSYGTAATAESTAARGAVHAATTAISTIEVA